MDTIWNIITYGIPSSGIAICLFMGRLFYLLMEKQKIRPITALLSYFVFTSIPIILAISLMIIGQHLGNKYGNYVFYGEATWGLATYIVIYFFFAVACNIFFWKRYLEITYQKTKNDVR